jgi:hypothetical protein
LASDEMGRLLIFLFLFRFLRFARLGILRLAAEEEEVAGEGEKS